MDTAERRVVAALWCVQQVGPKAIETIRGAFGGLGDLLPLPVAKWLPLVPLREPAIQQLKELKRLDEVADRLEAQLKTLGYRICFDDQPAYPELLKALPSAPPLLFYLGEGAAVKPRRRVAMVGSRSPETGFGARAKALAQEVAQAGVGIVSGAAVGVNQACHAGATEHKLETWAFLGCAIDQMDQAQARLKPAFSAGGTFFSEYPPGVRSDSTTFPQRNRLIAAAANATVVLRAAGDGGGLYTASAARGLGRPLLAMPGDATNPTAVGTNMLIKTGLASMCLSASDIFAAVGLRPEAMTTTAAVIEQATTVAASSKAMRVLALLDNQPRSFDELAAKSTLSSAALASSLMELELAGLVVLKPGRRYEKI